MSLLIPTNLSNAHKGKRKPDKSDYPISIQQGENVERELPDAGGQQKTAHTAPEFDELPRKHSPVPVTLVDLDPAQMDPDEYGAELGKEARVWKVYVQETDKWDRELVDGWNKSLDVILVFAALFSAVSTAFLIESSAMLQQDPNDVSATVLLAISQTLLVIANGSSVDLPILTSSSPDLASSFFPSQHAVIINSMLAKDWCHSFISNRTGHPWDQALRRQRKWAMIERWKMQELITVLPSLIHLSLGGKMVGEVIYESFARAQEYIRVTRVSKDNQDEMISLALQWLIQNCETPSSIAIALQAVAGASSKLPAKPLISCQATLQIFRRLVSTSPDSQTKADAERYTRALRFLESGIKLGQQLDREQGVLGNQRVEDDPEMESSRQTEGIEVMIWDLKAEHERQLVELINSTQILPTKENIEALSIGSTATSLGLRLLKGDTKPGYEAFESIIKRLYDPSQRLDPAAQQSLANAAIVLTLCSKSSLFPPSTVQERVELYASSLSTGDNDNPARLQDFQPTNVLATSTAFILCVLLHPSTLSISGRLHLNIFARAQYAVDMLTGDHLKTIVSQTMLYRVGLLAILFSPERYGITWNLGDTIDETRVAISNNYLRSRLLLSHSIRQKLCDHPQAVGDHPEILQFLSTIDQVSKLTELVTPQGTTTATLPLPVYWVLVYLSCVLRPDDQQQQCQRLMSKSGFPKLDIYLNCAINESIAGRNILGMLWGIYERSNSAPARVNLGQRFTIFQRRSDRHVGQSRQLIATQFWLLLCLIGDSSTELQKDLKTKIEGHTGLGLESQGVDSVKAELEEEIIEGYERGHRYGLYSARIIECILQARGTPQYDDFFYRIRRDLKDVPSNIRGLSSFLDQPVNPQSDAPCEHPPLDSSRVFIPPAPDVHTANQSNKRIRWAETDSPVVLSSTHDPNTEPPPSATPLSTLPDAETDGATAESTVNHITIPMLPDATGPDNC
ncbi:Rab GTPase-binding effector protein 1 [Rhizoctonia solani]|uniref:Rab GTPase-binding effector protein 1 n=1 Tax=Rhizoctonia solani TaxID=456999 RepID=A0A0K6GAE8_9AGAM|nr:Rab GTPase-binding effector protein 1 [Rhizoctonia solani]